MGGACPAWPGDACPSWVGHVPHGWDMPCMGRACSAGACPAWVVHVLHVVTFGLILTN